MSTGHLTPETLGAYVDGELAPGLERETSRHLQQCHPCTLRVLQARQLKDAVKATAASRFQPSAAAIERMKRAARPPAPLRAAVFPIRPMAWSAVAALLLLSISWALWQQARRSNALSAELLDQHLALLSSSAVPQVVSSDKHTVKPWFQGKLPFSFNLPEPAALPPDTTLQGADLAYVEGRPAALLLFMIHKHRVSVFITQQDQPPRMSPTSVRSGFNIDRSNANGLELFAISDVSRAELDALIQTLAKVQ